VSNWPPSMSTFGSDAKNLPASTSVVAYINDSLPGGQESVGSLAAVDAASGHAPENEVLFVEQPQRRNLCRCQEGVFTVEPTTGPAVIPHFNLVRSNQDRQGQRRRPQLR